MEIIAHGYLLRTNNPNPNKELLLTLDPGTEQTQKVYRLHRTMMSRSPTSPGLPIRDGVLKVHSRRSAALPEDQLVEVRAELKYRRYKKNNTVISSAYLRLLTVVDIQK